MGIGKCFRSSSNNANASFPNNSNSSFSNNANILPSNNANALSSNNASALSSDKSGEYKVEQDFREISWHQCQCSGSSQIPSQNDLNNYHKFLSLYSIKRSSHTTELSIYNTENGKKEVKYLDNDIIDGSTSITQLSNGELFCYSSTKNLYRSNSATLIIDRSYEVSMLPSGTACCWSSALYYNNNVYCFGGYRLGKIALSRKFDLQNNQWKYLASLPKADSDCHSVIFNGNILISGYKCKNLWLYSVEIDSFSIIPYEFACCSRKVLINVERLYLIEWIDNGIVYESEDEYNWKSISKTGEIHECHQMYLLYNKEKIYISAEDRYYQFDLKTKDVLEFKV